VVETGSLVSLHKSWPFELPCRTNRLLFSLTIQSGFKAGLQPPGPNRSCCAMVLEIGRPRAGRTVVSKTDIKPRDASADEADIKAPLRRLCLV
jgi:hypothetical protein